MKRLIGLILSAVLLTGLLTGCAGTATQDSASTMESTTDTTAESTAESSETAESVVEESTTEESTTEQSESDEMAFPRTYTDARGKEVTIEEKPERIAVATWMITEKLLAIDAPPVGADTVAIMSEWASMKEYFEKYQVEDLGTEVNIEKLLELKPDIILATTANEKIYDQLEAIAPVVVFDVDVMFGDWQTSTREVAKVVGEEAAAEAFIDDMMVQINQAKEKLSVDGKTVGFLRLWSKTIYSMGVSTCAAYYDDDKGLGLEIPQGWPEQIGELSLESLTEINPDYIFISTSEDEDYMDELSQNSVWNNLTAVKEGHVYSIDISALSGGSLASKYGIQVIIDALAE